MTFKDVAEGHDIFQFSFWDSRHLQFGCRGGCMNAFNSLFEIQEVRLEKEWEQLLKLSILFLRFPDCPQLINQLRQFQLSILFLRFEIICDNVADYFDLTFNSLFEIRMWAWGRKDGDGKELSILFLRFLICRASVSLQTCWLSILFLRFFSNPRNTTWLEPYLSILFLRFQMKRWPREYALMRSLSILFLRFGSIPP